MSNRSRITTVSVIVTMVMALSAPALAAGPKHNSCKGFGEAFVDFAQNSEDYGLRNAGEGISANARNGLDFFGDGTVVFTPPGSVAATVHFEHELFCDPA